MRNLTLLILALLATTQVAAQPEALRPSQFDALFTGEPRIEVNVSGALLGMVAEMTRHDEPEFAMMLRQLRGVHVRQYPLSAARSDIRAQISTFARGLERQGWEPLVRIRDGDQHIVIMLRPVDSVLDGLVVMMLSDADDEATFVTIDGRIDPAQIGRLGRQFNVPGLEHAHAAGNDR